MCHILLEDAVMPVPVPPEGRTKVELEDWKDHTVDSRRNDMTTETERSEYLAHLVSLR